MSNTKSLAVQFALGVTLVLLVMFVGVLIRLQGQVTQDNLTVEIGLLNEGLTSQLEDQQDLIVERLDAMAETTDALAEQVADNQQDLGVLKEVLDVLLVEAELSVETSLGGPNLGDDDRERLQQLQQQLESAQRRLAGLPTAEQQQAAADRLRALADLQRR